MQTRCANHNHWRLQHKHPTPQAPKKPWKQPIRIQKKHKKHVINILCNKHIDHKTDYHWTDISDLFIIHSKLEIPSQQPKANKQFLANKGKCLELIQFEEQ
jgi:hypothetical protein